MVCTLLSFFFSNYFLIFSLESNNNLNSILLKTYSTVFHDLLWLLNSVYFPFLFYSFLKKHDNLKNVFEQFVDFLLHTFPENVPLFVLQQHILQPVTKSFDESTFYIYIFLIYNLQREIKFTTTRYFKTYVYLGEIEK